mmetsp:Transcript_17952/g.28092  ORF Transcript_17952/g.28092 Transcript_17952/m.28092 type:complete len:170 (-) Transcript_17952:73-582(-)
MHRLKSIGHTSSVYLFSNAFSHPDFIEPPLDRQLRSRPRKGPPVAHNLDIYKKVHKLHQSAKWKMANISQANVNTRNHEIRTTHQEGRFDKEGMYRDFLYGNDRRLANTCGTVLFGMAIGIFFYTIDFLGSDKWDMPAPLLKKPDLIAEHVNTANAKREAAQTGLPVKS